MSESDYEAGFRAGYREAQQWVLVLNAYQRDNLLQLLNLIGYPYDHANQRGGIAPFTLLNTGDWVGEIAWMLRADGTEAAFQILAEKTGHPNQTRAYFERMVDGWVKSKVAHP